MISRFARAADPARISLALAALMAAVPFLLPEHRLPLPSFYDEWLGFALGVLAAAVFVLARRGAPGTVPEPALWLAAFAGWLLLQSLLRAPAYPQLPLSGIIYVLLAAQLVWLGHMLARELGMQAVVDALAWAILAAASANAAIGIVQHFGMPEWLGSVLARTAGPRSVGHVGQANLFADYLALGQACLLYLVARRRLAGRLAPIAGLLLVLGSACSQSRCALLFSLWIFGLSFCLRRGAPVWNETARHAGRLTLATLAAFVAIPALDRLLNLDAAGSGFGRIVERGQEAEPRLAAWALALRLFAGSPWLGVGWGEFAGAAFQAGPSPALAAHGGIWTSAHNLLLQLLAECGLAGAALVLMACTRWGRDVWMQMRAGATLPLWWIACVLGTIFLHSLLEYPLWYAHVLALAAFVAGAGSRATLQVQRLPLRAGLAAMNGLAAALLGWALVDYQRFDRAYVLASGRTLAAPGEVTLALSELQEAARGPLGAQVAPWLHQSRGYR